MPNVTGVLPLTRFQAGFETVHGTAVNATRRVYMLNGNLTERQDIVFPQEQRGSFTANYRGFATRRWVEMSGMQLAPTYEDLPWFLNQFVSPQTTGTPHAVTAYRYDFVPSISSNNLRSTTWEVGNDTQSYRVAGAIGTRFELGIAHNAPATMTVDYLGTQASPQSFTSNLPDRVTEDINGGLATAYIDTTTIGTTAVTNVLEWKMTVETGYRQMFAINGNLTPADVYRGETRKVSVEATLAFINTTEYALWQSSATGVTPRKIRMRCEGSAIPGASGGQKKQMDVDMYTVWQEAPFGEADGLHVVNFKGETIYDPTAGHDFRITVINAISSLP